MYLGRGLAYLQDYDKSFRLQVGNCFRILCNSRGPHVPLPA